MTPIKSGSDPSETGQNQMIPHRRPKAKICHTTSTSTRSTSNAGAGGGLSS